MRLKRHGYKLRPQWPITRGWFDPDNGNDMRGCYGFVKPWRWAIDWTVERPKFIADMSKIPLLEDGSTGLFDYLSRIGSERKP